MYQQRAAYMRRVYARLEAARQYRNCFARVIHHLTLEERSALAELLEEHGGERADPRYLPTLVERKLLNRFQTLAQRCAPSMQHKWDYLVDLCDGDVSYARAVVTLVGELLSSHQALPAVTPATKAHSPNQRGFLLSQGR